MNNIIALDDWVDETKPHHHRELECEHCEYKWMAVYPLIKGKPPERLECDSCGFMVAIGEACEV